VRPWGVLTAEVMAHQTPVARVSPVWRAWLERWPTPAALADAGPAAAISAWSGLGYPRRALRLVECAQRLVADHGGEVPAAEAQLRALPGIGEYTAAAVVSFAFGARAVVLDTNIRRVLARVLGGQPGVPAHITSAERERARSVLPAEPARAAAWNQAVMELGALVCTARSPACPACPLQGPCRWRRSGYAGAAPRRRRQGYTGTDRQARGALLRTVIARGSIPLGDLTADATTWPAAEQRARALAGLLADGLLVDVAGEVRLPGPTR